MRYHFEKPLIFFSYYGVVYHCNHPLYSECTLYRIGQKGLAIVQQRFDARTKSTSWGSIDPWFVDAIYLNERFLKTFDRYADKSKDQLYPTLTLRQILWALRIKPPKRESWETYFDRKPI